VSNQPDNSEAAASDARPPLLASTGQADDLRPLKIRSTRVASKGHWRLWTTDPNSARLRIAEVLTTVLAAAKAQLRVSGHPTPCN
jgi:hypothetical protein